MKRFAIAVAALALASPAPVLAADMALKAPLVPVPIAYTWTGCYAGGNVGGIWARDPETDQTPGTGTTGMSSGTLSPSSVLGGVQAGCDYQVSRWVLGVAGDFDWTNAKDTGTVLVFPALNHSMNITSLASVTGRIGYAFVDRFLGYVKGGGAWERVQFNTNFAATGALFASGSDTFPGWTIGVGGEYAFTNWLSAFAEYDYYNFGNRTSAEACASPGCAPGGASTVFLGNQLTNNVFKVGLNLRFNPLLGR